MTKPRKEVTPKELLLMHAYMIEAIINILEKRGILTKQEVLEEMKRLKAKDIGQEKKN
jgi:hypothetical protein